MPTPRTTQADNIALRKDFAVGTDTPITAPVYIAGSLELLEQVAGATPATDHVAIYAKADGRPYAKDDGGTEYDLSRPIPVGSLFITLPASNPAAELGYGTWAVVGTLETP